MGPRSLEKGHAQRSRKYVDGTRGGGHVFPNEKKCAKCVPTAGSKSLLNLSAKCLQNTCSESLPSPHEKCVQSTTCSKAHPNEYAKCL